MPEDRLTELYRPLSAPHLDRLRNWVPVESYASVELISHGEISVVRYRINTDRESLLCKRLAFASDFHTHAGAAARRRAALTAKLLKELAPDYLLLGGDLVYDSRDLNAFHELLAQLQGIAPVTLAIAGNWERGKSWLKPEFWNRNYQQYGMHFLCNQNFTDNDFFFYGSDDSSCGYPYLPSPPPDETRFNILLAHRPDTVVGFDAGNALLPYRLILCGHTHGGQIRLPFIGPLYASSRYGLHLTSGRFRREGGNSELIVSSGIGNRRFPGRFNCRREIVLIEFTRKSL